MAAVNTPVNKLGAANVLTAASVGTITQITTIATAVTLDNNVGVITTLAATAAAAGAAPNVFTVNNSQVTATSIVNAYIISYAGTGNPVVVVTSVAAGSFVLQLSSISGAAALNAPVKIAFEVRSV